METPTFVVSIEILRTRPYSSKIKMLGPGDEARWQKAEDEVKVQGVHIQVCWTPVKAGMQALKQTWDEASINTFKYVGRL